VMGEVRGKGEKMQEQEEASRGFSRIGEVKLIVEQSQADNEELLQVEIKVRQNRTQVFLSGLDFRLEMPSILHLTLVPVNLT
jgi:hypothetical protein